MFPALLMVLMAHADPQGDAPPAGVDEMHRALSTRDGSPPCDEVEALSDTPAEALLYIAEHAQQPPWAGVRAAECLVSRHAEAIQPQLEQWVQDPSTRGFALVVFNAFDTIPEAVAIPVAQAALAGDLSEDARVRLEGVQNPSIKLLLEESP